MTDRDPALATPQTFGDAAVDGLVAGVLAGLAMAVYLAVIGLARGEALGLTFGRFDTGAARSPLTGALVHLAVAGVYGVVYGLGRGLLNRSRGLGSVPGWLTGAAFGLAIWAVAHVLILPGTQSPLRELSPLVFLPAHLVYGVPLGMVFARR
jgi:hypothetical protein